MKGGRKGRIGEEGREQRKEVVVEPEGLTEWKRGGNKGRAGAGDGFRRRVMVGSKETWKEGRRKEEGRRREGPEC